MNTKNNRVAAACLTSVTRNQLQQNYQNPQGADKKKENMECTEYKMQ